MSYRQRRRLYSQNFLRNSKLVSKLVGSSSIGKNDLVLEIGSGKGSITRELINVAGKVIAVEIDQKLTFYLKEKLQFAKNLEIVHADFLNYELPKHPYRVFANLPFHITSDILRKLTKDSFFIEGFLIVQKEAAKKFIGKPYDDKNSMMATLLKPWFNISVIHNFSRYDFVPFPHVDSTMIRIIRSNNPLLPHFQSETFRDFVVYKYNREKIMKLEFNQILTMFHKFLSNSSKDKIIFIKNEARKIIEAQKTIQKIHKTRNDRNWRKF